MRMRAQMSVTMLATVLATVAMAQPAPHSATHTPQSRVGMISAEVARSLMKSHGFENLEGLRLEGYVYRADATKSGNRVNVELDAITGRVLKP